MMIPGIMYGRRMMGVGTHTEVMTLLARPIHDSHCIEELAWIRIRFGCAAGIPIAAPRPPRLPLHERSSSPTDTPLTPSSISTTESSGVLVQDMHMLSLAVLKLRRQKKCCSVVPPVAKKENTALRRSFRIGQAPYGNGRVEDAAGLPYMSAAPREISGVQTMYV